jgi:hypothetical protein
VAFAIRIVHLPIAKIAASQNFGATELTYCAGCSRNSTINSKQTSCGARLVGEHHMRPVSEYYASADRMSMKLLHCSANLKVNECWAYVSLRILSEKRMKLLLNQVANAGKHGHSSVLDL